jgi:hypothetical protein
MWSGDRCAIEIEDACRGVRAAIRISTVVDVAWVGSSPLAAEAALVGLMVFGHEMIGVHADALGAKMGDFTTLPRDATSALPEQEMVQVDLELCVCSLEADLRIALAVAVAG